MENQTQNNVNFLANLILKILLAVIAVALLFYSAGGGIFTRPLLSFKREKPTLAVANTPMTVQDVRAVGKLVTASFYDEMVIKRKKEDLVRTKDKTKGEIVIIQKAHVRIGVDLAKLRDKDIQVQGDTAIRITLPPVECLHVIMNPTDTDIYSETTAKNKKWSFDQFQEVLEPARDSLIKKVYASKAMEKAALGAEQIVTEFLTACGYKHIYIGHRPIGVIQLPAPETGTADRDVTPGA